MLQASGAERSHFRKHLTLPFQELREPERASLWLSGKESACQCRVHRFDPWAGKVPWRKKFNPVQFSCLGNPRDRGDWWVTAQGCKASDTTWRLDSKDALFLLVTWCLIWAEFTEWPGAKATGGFFTRVWPSKNARRVEFGYPYC